MSYKFVKVTSFYNEFLRDLYLNKPNLKDYSYKEQYDFIRSKKFGWSDFYTKELEKLGVTVFDEIIANGITIQRKWAEEHNVFLEKEDLLIEQLKHSNPEVVFLQDVYSFNGEFLNRLRKEIPSIKLIVGWLAAPYNNELLLKLKSFDIMLTCSPAFVNVFLSNGIKSYMVSHAFENSLLDQLDYNSKNDQIDICFTGSFLIGNGHHNQRIEFINELILKFKNKSYNIALFGIANKLLFTEPYKTKYKYLISNLNNPVYGIDMYNTLAKSKITLNMHIDAADKFAGNMRLFEATGVGSCLVTDWKENLHDFFEIDKEVIAYKDLNECIEKIEWLLLNNTQRESIAKNGQKRTLKSHNFTKRAKELNKIILEHIS